MSRRTALYLRFIVPLRVYARDRVIWWLENAIDRLDIDRCQRFDNAVTFREFMTDDDLFTFGYLFDDDDWL
jgi:hypothetical protein